MINYQNKKIFRKVIFKKTLNTEAKYHGSSGEIKFSSPIFLALSINYLQSDTNAC